MNGTFTAASNSKGCHLRWSRLTKVVPVKEKSTGLLSSSIAPTAATAPEEEHKVILNEVSGQALPSQILALMGPSGSGKTTLLDALSGRSAINSGSLTVNGMSLLDQGNKRMQTLKRKIAYIKQQDIFFTHLTVRDQLTYTALLRLPSSADKNAQVSTILSLLRLNKAADTTIQLLSGGERKRVNIGTELLTDPDILLLDEPTSGLDSTSAVALIKMLHSLCKPKKDDAKYTQKTIITSIHQPSSAVFHSFDKLMLLAEGGCVVYFGTPKASLGYLRERGFDCPGGYNAADYWMDLLVVDSALEPEDDEEVGVASSKLLLAQARSKNETAHSSTPTDNHDFTIDDEENEAKEDEKVEDAPKDLSYPTDQVALSLPAGSAHDTDDDDDNVVKKASVWKKASSIVSRSQAKKNRANAVQLAKTNRSKAASGTTDRAQLIRAWDNEGLAVQMDLEDIDDASHSITVKGGEEELTVTSKFNTTWWTQFKILTHRSLKNSRSAIFTPLNLVKSCALGLMAGLLWYQMEYTERTVNDRASYFFFTMSYWVFDATFFALLSFPAERAIIFKERASGSYYLSAYFVAKTTSEAPTRLALPFLYMIISYWIASVNKSFVIFLEATGCTLLSVLAGESMGLFIGAAVMDFEGAMTVMTVVAWTLFVAGGYFVQNIPSFLTWLKYLSPFKYAFDASQQLVFDKNVPCDGSGVLETVCGNGDVGYATHQQVIDYLDVNGNVGFNVGLLVLIFVGVRYAAFLVLKSKRGAERS